MQEFNKYLDLSTRFLKSIEPNDLIQRIQSEESRNALYSPAFNHLRSFGGSLKTLIDSPSSDEGSDDLVSYPSVQKVSQRILDMASITLNDGYVPAPHVPCLVIAPVKASLKAHKLQQLLERYQILTLDVQIVNFNIQYSTAALLWFGQIAYANIAFEKIWTFNTHEEELSEVKFMKWVNYKLYYPETKFYAVILRGFNKKARLQDINRMLPVPAKRCEIRIINNIACGFFCMNSILDVCLICKKMNNFRDSSGNLIKAHVHPFTQKKYSQGMMETLISDLPNTSVREQKESVDVYKLLDQGMTTMSRQVAINPLENLVRAARQHPK
jgi:hypothetical protein